MQLGEEKIPPTEASDIREIVTMMKGFLEKKYAPGETLRHFHPKMHGCVKAKFIIGNSLPPELQHGLFTSPGEYNAWVRFSNAPPGVKPDYNRAGRGMGIKVLDVLGESIVADPIGQPTQDFLMSTSTVLSPGFVSNYLQAMRGLINGFPQILWYILNPGNWRRVYLTVKAMQKHPNLLETTFFSGSPFRFGEAGYAVKFGAFPQKSPTSKMPKNPVDWYLRQRLESDLSAHEARFDLCIQQQKNAQSEPIEDTSKEWKTPWIPVATLVIPKQIFLSQDQIAFGENMSFNPWHCLPDHRPLGGINRSRKVVYGELAKFRLERNGIKKTSNNTNVTIK